MVLSMVPNTQEEHHQYPCVVTTILPHIGANLELRLVSALYHFLITCVGGGMVGRTTRAKELAGCRVLPTLVRKKEESSEMHTK